MPQLNHARALAAQNPPWPQVDTEAHIDVVQEEVASGGGGTADEAKRERERKLLPAAGRSDSESGSAAGGGNGGLSRGASGAGGPASVYAPSRAHTASGAAVPPNVVTTP